MVRKVLKTYIDAGIAFLMHDDEVLVDLAPEEYYGAAPDMGACEWDPGQSVLDRPGLSPFEFTLSCAPNPFNPATTISYSLPRAGRVGLEVFNLLGQKVGSLADEMQTAGSYTVTFSGLNLASGVYIYQLTAGKEVVTRKMILVK